MTTLEQTQKLFFRCVRFDPAPPELEDVFAPGRELSAREAMAVYRDMYWFRQVDALFDVFPRLAAELGKERFTRLCCRYLTVEPSSFPELERIGHAFPRYIRETPNELVADRELFADLADLELAALEALLAPPSPPALPLTSVDPARLPYQSMTLAPALELRTVGVAALSSFRGEPQAGEEPRRSVLFTRPQFAVRHRVLDPDEASALERARSGLPVAEICVPFATPERASTALRRWFDDDLVLSLSEPS